MSWRTLNELNRLRQVKSPTQLREYAAGLSIHSVVTVKPVLVGGDFHVVVFDGVGAHAVLNRAVAKKLAAKFPLPAEFEGWHFRNVVNLLK